MKLKLASVSPGRVVEIQFAGPTARVAATAVQEAHFESQEGFISLLLGHFKSSWHFKWPVRWWEERSLPLGSLLILLIRVQGAFVSRVSLLLAIMQLPGCWWEAVRLWDVLRVDLAPSTWRHDCGKKPSDALRVYLHLPRLLVQESRSYGGGDLGHQKH